MSTEELSDVSGINVQKQTKHGCRWGCFGCLIFVLIAAVPFWWFCLHTTPLRISKETTYVTKPKTADGKRIDYFNVFEEYYPPEMKTEDNGYRIFVRACGFTPLFGNNNEDVRKQVYEKLGLDPNIEPTMKLESPDIFLSRLQEEKPDDKILEKYNQQETFWTLNDFPQLENWLKENDVVLDLIGEAVRKPVFRMPFVRNGKTMLMFVDNSLTGSQVYREIVRAVRGRANYRIGIGNIDGAIDDTMTIHQLGGNVSHLNVMVGVLVGLSLEVTALNIGINGNPEHPATKEQIERYLKEFIALPPMVTFKEAIEPERWFGLGLLQDIFTQPAFDPDYNDMNDNGILCSPKFLRWGCDPNIVFKIVNNAYDELPSLESINDDARVSHNPLCYITVQERSENIARKLSASLCESLHGVKGALQRYECQSNMKRLTLALLLYKKDHGNLPDGDWQTAIRPYLGGNTDKYFRCPSNKETEYTLLKDDKYLLLVESKSQHPGGYNASYRSGAVRFQSSKEK